MTPASLDLQASARASVPAGSPLPARQRSDDRSDPEGTHAQLQALRALLQSCRADEIDHRDEAALLLGHPASPPPLALRLWVWSVGAGSRTAVKVSRRV